MPDKAFAVHGLSAKFLSDFPDYIQIHEEFVAFIVDSPLVIHNAAFDMALTWHF
jgi:DNA polymerase-3 subunit epsilon